MQQTFTDLKNVFHANLVNVADSVGLVALQTESEFHQKGVLTPQEVASNASFHLIHIPVCCGWRSSCAEVHVVVLVTFHWRRIH
jgi:hypothetical protein